MGAKYYDAFAISYEGKKIVRGKKLHDSVLTPDQANTLNEQKKNTKIEYVLRYVLREVPQKAKKK